MPDSDALATVLQMQHPDLTRFLAAYPEDPLGSSPAECRRAWSEAIYAGYTADDLILAAEQYAKLTRSQDLSPMAPASWLAAMAKSIADDDESAEFLGAHREGVLREHAAILAAGVRAYRHGLNWSRPTLADRSGIADGTIFNVEKGEKSGTSFSTIVALADAFGASVEEVLELGARFVR